MKNIVFKKYLLLSILILFVVFLLPKISWAATYHYVYPGLTTGNNNGSSWTNAWRSFANINWAMLQTEVATQPVYLYIKKGSTSTTALTVGASGSSDTNRIFITVDPTDTGGNPILSNTDRGVDLRGRKYTTVSHLEITGTSTVNNAVNLDSSSGYNTFDNLAIHDVNTNAFYINGANVNDIIITNGRIFNIGSRGSYTYDAIAGGGSNQIIRGNIIYNICEDAIETGGSNLVIDNNEIYSLGWSTAVCAESHPDALQLGNVTGLIFSNNYIHDLPSQSLYIGDWYVTIDILIYNNVFHHIPSGSGIIAIAKGSGYCKIYNNIFYDNTGDGLNIGTGFTTIDIKNNIFYQTNTAGITTSGTVTSDYNDLYQSINLNGTSYTSLAAWQAALGGCPGSDNDCNSVWEVDPVIVSLESKNFHLTASTPSTIKDAGIYLSETFTTDKDGISRPQGSAWDIGAYEYVGSTPDTVPPATPTGVIVQ